MRDVDTIFRIKDICSLLTERKDNVRWQNNIYEKQAVYPNDYSQVIEYENSSIVATKNNKEAMKLQNCSLDTNQEICDTYSNIQSRSPKDDNFASLQNVCSVEKPECGRNEKFIKQETSEMTTPNENKSDILSSQQYELENYDKLISPLTLSIQQQTRRSNEIEQKITSEVTCIICSKTFTSRKELKMHNQEVHPNDRPSKV